MRKSRAVRRLKKPLSQDMDFPICPGCGDTVRFMAPQTLASPKHAGQTDHQIIANVYSRGRWVRTEHWCEGCYDGRYGPPVLGEELPVTGEMLQRQAAAR